MTNVPAAIELSQKQLDLARNMARAGCKAALIRCALGGRVPIPPKVWKELHAPTPDGDPSPLSLAIETGQADLAHEIVSFMLGKMRGQRQLDFPSDDN